MIEWIRKIVAGFIGLHACGRHPVSHIWGRVVRWSLSGRRRKVVKPTGTLTCGGAWPAAAAAARPVSQYARAAEVPVPVSQYSVMLSRTWSRLRPPEGCGLSLA